MNILDVFEHLRISRVFCLTLKAIKKAFFEYVYVLKCFAVYFMEYVLCIQKLIMKLLAKCIVILETFQLKSTYTSLWYSLCRKHGSIPLEGW